ncbi:TetR family transcriptional regulator, partial [Streptomyces sp. Act-28]
MTSPPPYGRTELSLTPVEAPPHLRADAARNRARLLEAAARLAAEQGAANLTMEAVACAAQVGKGTVFRRFGDRSGRTGRGPPRTSPRVAPTRSLPLCCWRKRTDLQLAQDAT